jgi:hypothetical protein
MKCGVKCGLDSARSEWGPVVGLMLDPEKARNLLTVWNETVRERHEDRLHPCYWDNNASKAVPIPPCSVQGGEELRLLLILDLSTRWVEWSASCPGRALPSGKPRCPLYRRLGGPQSWSRHRGWRKNPLPLPGTEPRSSSLLSVTYWLSYPSSNIDSSFINADDWTSS